MRKKSSLVIYLSFLLALFIIVSSCSKGIDPIEEVVPQNSSYTSEEIATFSTDDLNRMKSLLEESGMDVASMNLDVASDLESDPSTRGIFVNNPCVKAIKVSSKTLHPDRSGKYITVSGVLLVPQTDLKSKTYRIAIVPPPTYTENKTAPSNAFKKMSLINVEDLSANFSYFWILQAMTGYIVFIPDYPGFGDSNGQCFHPYLDSEIMVNSTLDLFKSALNTLSTNGYRYKKEIVLSGYSLGAFVATSLARKIETDPMINYTVSLLVAGGTPCNLKQISDATLQTNFSPSSFLLAYGLWGYKENAYPELAVSDFLQEPYASQSKKYFDGTYNLFYVNEYFSHKPSEVYTKKFISSIETDPSIILINQILDKNSVKPWKNKCKFVMTHGKSDITVFYQNAKDFSDQQNAYGGNVSFYPTIGDHAVAFAPYFLKASAYLHSYK